jgi:hypothetical protein
MPEGPERRYELICSSSRGYEAPIVTECRSSLRANSSVGVIRKSEDDVTPQAAPAMKSPGSRAAPDEIGLDQCGAGVWQAPLMGRRFVDRRVYRRSGLRSAGFYRIEHPDEPGIRRN